MNYSLSEFSKSIRMTALEMTSQGGSSHIGSIFSCADIVSVLYGAILNVHPNNLDSKSRDRFILSKGHAGAGVYVALAKCGFITEDMLEEHYQNGSLLSGHISHKIPGVEVSTGSLGHGLPIGVGLALAGVVDNNSYRVFVLMSDGECDEGSNWEAILLAAHHKLNNLVVIIDYNKLQSINSNSDTLNLEPFRQKWESFGWYVDEVDGHNHDDILYSLSNIDKKKPTCVIAHTIKGRGVSFMENSVLWHYRTARGDELHDAMRELEEL